jgi:hypothetical protein
MVIFLRNLGIACLGMMALVGLMAAGVVIWMVLLILVGVMMGYLALRKAGIINPPKSPFRKQSGNAADFQNQVIEAEYTIISESEQQIEKDRV